MTPDLSAELGTADLRRALRAVTAFVGKGIEDWERVQLRVHPVFTTVSATNGSASALAVVSTIGMNEDAGDVFVFDLSLEDAKKIAGIFDGKDATDDDPEDMVRVDVDAEHVQVTDASGMIEVDGQQLVLPRLPMLGRDDAPSVPQIVGQFIHATPTAPKDGTVTLHGPFLALVTGAAKVYKTTDVTLEHHDHPKGGGRVVLARVGEDFLATLVARRLDDSDEARIKGYADAWRRRIAHQPLKAVK